MADHEHEWGNGIGSANGMVTHLHCGPCRRWIKLDEPIPYAEWIARRDTTTPDVHDAPHDDDPT